MFDSVFVNIDDSHSCVSHVVAMVETMHNVVPANGANLNHNDDSMDSMDSMD